MAPPRPAGSYGTDAPWVPWLWLGLGLLYVVLAVCAATLWDAPAFVAVITAVIAVLFLLGALSFWYATLRGKFVIWDGLLAAAPAPHHVLDVGCGRGAVAIMIAERFPDARVDGVDLWRSIDQSGNSPDAARANARENGVADRISFTTADMTELPFHDDEFDLVTASLSIHNVPSAEGRRRALAEAWRVLASDGRLVIVDIGKVREYPAVLTELGAVDLTIRDAGWRGWWSGPWMGTRILTAGKALD
jgi:SAM-dependent methyltransferase